MKLEVLLPQLRQLMADADFAWAICGGYALDLFLNRNTRMHGDVDLCVFETDREKVVEYFAQRGWRVYEYCGQGKVRRIGINSKSEAGRNLMCVLGAPAFVRFYPCDEAGLFYHEFFHVGMDTLNFIDILFNKGSDGDFTAEISSQAVRRKWEKAVLRRGNVPFLAPEMVLLFKAANAEKEEYRLDFEQTYCCMNQEQKLWFTENLQRLYPCGHAWMR